MENEFKPEDYFEEFEEMGLGEESFDEEEIPEQELIDVSLLANRGRLKKGELYGDLKTEYLSYEDVLTYCRTLKRLSREGKGRQRAAIFAIVFLTGEKIANVLNMKKEDLIIEENREYKYLIKFNFKDRVIVLPYSVDNEIIDESTEKLFEVIEKAYDESPGPKMFSVNYWAIMKWIEQNMKEYRFNWMVVQKWRINQLESLHRFSKENLRKWKAGKPEDQENLIKALLKVDFVNF